MPHCDCRDRHEVLRSRRWVQIPAAPSFHERLCSHRTHRDRPTPEEDRSITSPQIVSPLGMQQFTQDISWLNTTQLWLWRTNTPTDGRQSRLIDMMYQRLPVTADNHSSYSTSSRLSNYLRYFQNKRETFISEISRYKSRKTEINRTHS